MLFGNNSSPILQLRVMGGKWAFNVNSLIGRPMFEWCVVKGESKNGD